MRSLSSIMSPFAVVLVIVLAGCGPSRARPEPGGGGEGSGFATEERAVTSDACPATYAEVKVGARCGDTEAACSFAEGRCWCGPRSYCGGAAPPREVLEELARPAWQCKPVRTDGCPEAEPSGACSAPGQVCNYGDCCFVQLTCRGGAWERTGGGCPP